MRRLALFAYDRRRRVAGAWIAVAVGVAVLASVAGGQYSSNFRLPGTESQRAYDLLQSRFPQQSGDNSQIVFRASSGKLAAHRAAVQSVLAKVAKLPEVAAVGSPFAKTGAVSRDGRTGLATLQFTKQANDLQKADIERVVSTARAANGAGLQVALGGQAIQVAQHPAQSAAEGIGVLVAVVVLLVTLGSAVAMGLPLLSAFLAIGIAMGLVSAASAVIDIADFSTQLAVMIGLGVGIDYALLVLTRFRAERAEGPGPREATATAMDTAGRSVLFAGVTVVIALLGMLLLGVSFLRGPALAAALTVACTMLATLTLLPALLGFFGRRVKVRDAPGREAEPGVWRRWSEFVERRPWPIAAVSLVVLLVIASPATNMHLGSSDAGNDAPSKTTRQAYDMLAGAFGPGFNGPLLVAAELPRSGGDAALARLAARVRAEPGVAGVSPATTNRTGNTATLEVFPTTAPQDERTKALLERLRSDVVPRAEHATGLHVFIGGSTASLVDLGDVLSAKLPLFIGVVVGLSLLLLALVFRSLLIPLKAAVMNLLSIGAAFGVVTWIFQEGHLASLIGVQATGPIESFLPVFLFAIVFGLSMDYEVFLVSRMHEEWERRHDPRYAVRHGLAVTGKVVFAAALIMVSVFGSFILGDDRIIKLFGVGLASAVLIDALVIRLALVPALMIIFGRASWWLPKRLDRALPRLSIEGPAPAPERGSA